MKTIWTEQHKRLVALLTAKRKARGITQSQLAYARGKTQAWVSQIESGQRRIIVDEFLDLAEAIGFAALDEIRGPRSPGNQ
jgi:transcriptional regulator with XRE-family HTH domain